MAKKKSAARKQTTASPAKKRTTTTDAVEIVNRRYVEGQPERIRELVKARADDEIACKLFKLRTDAGLSQRELATRIGTTASVICRLEDADYDGHSLAMLRRVAAALGRRVDIRFVQLSRKVRTA